MVDNSLDIAWLAGLYEGEGTICRIVGRKGPTVRMSIRMTDAEPIARCQRIVGGHFRGPYRDGRITDKDKYGWDVCSWRDLIRVCDLIRPYLSPRRTVQMDKVLAHRPDHPRGTLACPDVPFPSEAGYFRHRTLGIPICEVCRESHRLYIRDLNLRRKGHQDRRLAHAGKHIGPRKSTVLICSDEIRPSVLGYRRHQALGVPACENCLKSAALYQSARRQLVTP